MKEYKFEDYHFEVWCQDNGAWCGKVIEIPGEIIQTDGFHEVE